MASRTNCIAAPINTYPRDAKIAKLSRRTIGVPVRTLQVARARDAVIVFVKFLANTLFVFDTKGVVATVGSLAVTIEVVTVCDFNAGVAKRKYIGTKRSVGFTWKLAPGAREASLVGLAKLSTARSFAHCVFITQHVVWAILVVVARINTLVNAADFFTDLIC